MSHDISRPTSSPWNDFLGVVMQQGRVQLDSDWNEWQAEVTRRIQAGTMDTIGLAVYPATTPNAFRIKASQVNGVRQITIGAGRMYVDGLMVENHGPVATPQWDSALAELSGAPAAPPNVAEVDLDFTAQPYLRDAALLPSNGPFLVYLDVWRRPVTYVEYPELIETAVGVDTTGRLQTVWQVKLLDVSDIRAGIDCSTLDSAIPKWASLLQPPASQLTAFAAPSTTSGPCCLTPSIGYTGMENQLYRVEIHQGGSANASGSANPVSATFKWSRDNASVITAVTAIGSATNVAGNQTTQLTVQSTGRDDILSFKSGDWIEITDDFLELNGQPGELHRIETNGVSKALKTITLQTAVSSVFQTRMTRSNDYHTRICRWDRDPTGKVLQSDGVTVWTDLDAPSSTGQIPVPPPGTSLILENGVTVTFSVNPAIVNPAGGSFAPGHFWSFAARASDGTVQPLKQAPPIGIHHHYARLAVVTFPSSFSDCRTIWPPTISAGADCACTVCVDAADHNSGVATIAMAVDQVRSKGGGRVCLGPGEFKLNALSTPGQAPSPLQLTNLESVVLSGVGPATLLTFQGDGPAILAETNLGLRIQDLSVVAIATPLSTPPPVARAPARRAAAVAPAPVIATAIGILLRNCIGTTIERCGIYALPAKEVSSTPLTINNAAGAAVSDVFSLINTPGAVLPGLSAMAVALDGFLIETLIRDNALVADVGVGTASLFPRSGARSVMVLADLAMTNNFMACTLAGSAILDTNSLLNKTGQLTVFSLETACRTNRVVNCSRFGIAVMGVSTGNAAIRIADNHIDVSGVGIVCAADGAEIADNLITQTVSPASSDARNFGPGAPGIAVASESSQKIPVAEARILRNRINSHVGPGITVGGLVLISSIVGNSIKNAIETGILVAAPQGRSSTALIRDNEIFGVTAPGVPNSTNATGIQVSDTTTATIEDNTVASIGPTPSTATGIEVSNSTTTLILDNEVTDIGTPDTNQAPAHGVNVAGGATTTVSDNAIQQGTAVQAAKPSAFLAIEIVTADGAANVSGNQLFGTSRLALASFNVADCVFSANICRQLASHQALDAVVKATDKTLKTFIASGNRIFCSGQKIAMDIGAEGAKVRATVLGNITGAPIHLDGQPLDSPWAPLNINA